MTGEIFPVQNHRVNCFFPIALSKSPSFPSMLNVLFPLVVLCVFFFREKLFSKDTWALIFLGAPKAEMERPALKAKIQKQGRAIQKQKNKERTRIQNGRDKELPREARSKEQGNRRNKPKHENIIDFPETKALSILSPFAVIKRCNSTPEFCTTHCRYSPSEFPENC